MRKLFLVAIFVVFTLTSCIEVFHKTISGNGRLSTEQRAVGITNKIKSYGNFDVNIVRGTPGTVKVEADENIIPYIITETRGDALVIHLREGYNLKSKNKIRVVVTTDELREVEVTASGNIKGEEKLSSRDYLKLAISGSGDINLNANTPRVESHINGSGNITLNGETRDSKIEIAGNGNYQAPNLMSENVEIHITGSGNASVYAEHNLNIHIAGSGDVTYRGNANVKQSIAGSGRIKRSD